LHQWLQAYCRIAQCGLEKTLAMSRMMESYSLETRGQLAQRRVFQICEALHDMRWNITVDVYTGGLRRALESYANREVAQLLVMQPRVYQRIMNVLPRAIFVSSVFSRSFASSMPLFHSDK
jgi:hypothetical protein